MSNSNAFNENIKGLIIISCINKLVIVTHNQLANGFFVFLSCKATDFLIEE